MVKKIDWHMHSNRSDGDLSPTELMRKCREQGVDYPILTDHDTVAGTEEAIITAERLNIRSSAGIELSSVHKGRGFHILGLGINYQNKILLDELDRSRGFRLKRAEKIILELEKYGWKVDNSILNKANGIVTRGEVAEAVKDKAMSANEFFYKWLCKDCPCFVGLERIDAKKAIELIHETGGIAILAHPAKTMEKDLKLLPQIVREFKALGLDGLEVFYSEYNEMQTKIMYALALKYKYLMTHGSDFHRDNSLRELGKCNLYGLKFYPEKVIDSLPSRG